MFASFANRWLVVFACVFGLTAVGGTVNSFAFAIFLKPLSTDLGISRSLLCSCLFVTMLISGVATPFLGSLSDRWGSRRVLLVGIPLFGLSTAAFVMIQPSLLSMYALFALTGLFGAMQNTVPYIKVVSKWFDAERGLAIGIASAGVGLGVVIVPELANSLVQAVGWRLAYVGLGIFIFLVAFVPVLLFVREPLPEELPHNVGVGREPPGLSATEVFSVHWRFWAMCGGFFLAVISTHGTLGHAVAMLTDRGVSLGQATTVLSAAGIGVILGRIVCGWCLDRFNGPRVAVCFFIIPAFGVACFGSRLQGFVPLSGGLLIGAGFGAHVALMAFFVGRYFGLKAYGKLFGTMFGFFLVGSGLGPVLHGLSFDLLHSYDPALIGSTVCLLIASLLFAPLGPYPFAQRETKASNRVQGSRPIPSRVASAAQ